MTTSAMQSILARSNDGTLTARELAVFEGYAQNAAHSAVLAALEKVRGTITQAAIARRLGVNPSQVTRWLSSPGNYEMKTLGYLLGAMGYVPEIAPVEIASLTRGNNFVHEAADIPMYSIQMDESSAAEDYDRKFMLPTSSLPSSTETTISIRADVSAA